MGDPRKARKTYHTPKHPWEKERIDAERVLLRDYGLKNKQEIMRMGSLLKNFKDQAKKYIASRSKQADRQKQLLLVKIQKLGLVNKTATMDDVLGLSIESIFERRLQTLVFRQGLARSINQARQYIIHRHIMVKEQKVTVPSYLVTKEEEKAIHFVAKSTLADPEHPERKFEQKPPEEQKEKDNATTRKETKSPRKAK